ncbi:MAG: pyridoxal phosphate-dependent aminotransferase [Flavobacteriaceae bacterium]|nr:pyridoxal phosphate-dependent aminotransferase [Flavobacteriaceae bacterium]
MPKISRKGANLPSSPIRKLAHQASQAEARGTQIYYLNIGQPDYPSPKRALKAIQDFDNDVIEYGPSEGSQSFREKLTQYYRQHSIDISADDILVTTGASEAIIMALDCITNEGDELIIPEPFYANYGTFAAACGVTVVGIPSAFETQFSLPPVEKIEAAITKRTRALFVCNPNNPSGYVYSKFELKALAKLAIKYDIFFIVDEVYREFVYDGNTHDSVMNLDGIEDHAILIDSMSKRYSMCGARIGFLISKNQEVIQAALKFAQSRLCPPTIAMHACEAALDEPEQYLIDALAEYEVRRETTITCLRNIHGVEVAEPKGAFYCLARLPVNDTDDFAKWMLESFEHHGETVMIAPANGFFSDNTTGKDMIRIAFVLNSKKLERAIELLGLGLAEYVKK